MKTHLCVFLTRRDDYDIPHLQVTRWGMICEAMLSAYFRRYVDGRLYP